MGFLSDTWRHLKRGGAPADDGVNDWLQDVWDSMRGKTSANAALRAGDIIEENEMKGIDLMRPYYDTGTMSLPGMMEGATIEGYGNRIGSIIDSGALQPLINERQRAANAYMQSQGLTRSSYAAEKAAELPMETIFNMENMLRNRESHNANMGYGAAGQIGGAFSRIGDGQAQAILGNAAARDKGANDSMDFAGKIVSTIGSFFSDENLKESMVKVDRLGDLNVYKWNWNKKAKDMYGLSGEGVGFSAQEVQKAYPDLVSKNDDGVLQIQLERVLERVA